MKYKERKIVCPNCKREMRFVIPEETTEGKLEQFLNWLKEEDPYPLLDHNDLIAALEEYETEIETSSEKEVNVL